VKVGVKTSARLRVVVPPLVVLLLGVVGYLAAVAPERSHASSLSKQITSAQSQLTAAGGAQATKGPKIRVADTFRLTKAMPDQLDMAGMILDLSRIAEASHVTFQSVQQTSGPTQATGYEEIPLTLGFQGRFADLSSFLQRLRQLVAVRNGELEATGRLFIVDSFEFSNSDTKQPRMNLVKATLNVSAFVFGSAAGAQPASATAGGTTSTTSTTTTSSTTTSTTTTPSSSSSASAAGPVR
jgi:Tfp pilus assembly protein PilO